MIPPSIRERDPFEHRLAVWAVMAACATWSDHQWRKYPGTPNMRICWLCGENGWVA